MVIALGAWSPASVSARQGSDDSSESTVSSTATTSTTPEDSHGGNSGSGRNNNETVHRSSNQIQSEPEKGKEAERNSQDARAKADQLRTKLEDSPGKRLGDDKLKICQKRENGIGMIMGRVGDRSQKQLDLYTTVSARAQAFVTKKQLTVASYDQLLADIAAKKTAAQAAVDKVKSDKAGFTCDGSDPVGTGSLFKADAKAQSEALKAYRSSVKVLLDAIKTAAKATTPTSSTGGNQ